MATYLEKLAEELEQTPEYITEEAILDFLDDLEVLLEEYGVKKSTLAKRANLDPSQISRILKGNHNITIKTLGKIACALKCRLAFQLVPKTGAGSCRIDASVIQVEKWDPDFNIHGNSHDDKYDIATSA